MLIKASEHLQLGSLLKTLDKPVSYKELVANNLPVLAPYTPLAEVIPWLVQEEVIYIADEKSGVVGTLDSSAVLQALWEALLTLETQLEATLGTVHEAVTIINDEDQVVAWSKRAAEMYSIDPASILGQKINNFFSSLVVTQVLKNGEVRDSYHHPCQDTHVLINASPIRQGEQIIGSVGAERDITETVYLHNELSKASSKVRLLQAEIKKIAPNDAAFTKIAGKSKRIKEIVALAKKVAKTNAAILLTGESGTGKELFAEAIHLESQRRDHPFVVVNCGAIPASLFEREVFGQDGGFDKQGRLALAQRGTIFFDEIDSLEPDLQVKLFKALQTKKAYPVGGKEPLKLDIRVIAATNRDLKKLISQGLFREDLYYQLSIVSAHIPPLRERKDDLPELVYALVQEFSNQYGAITQIEPELMLILLNYPWPGNLRELRNVVERLVILAEGETLAAGNLPEPLVQWKNTTGDLGGSNLTELTDRTERQVIIQTLEEAGGNKSQAARLLGIPRSTLYYKMKALKIG